MAIAPNVAPEPMQRSEPDERTARILPPQSIKSNSDF
jgi:hypothetical protein